MTDPADATWTPSTISTIGGWTFDDRPLTRREWIATRILRRPDPRIAPFRIPADHGIDLRIAPTGHITIHPHDPTSDA